MISSGLFQNPSLGGKNACQFVVSFCYLPLSLLGANIDWWCHDYLVLYCINHILAIAEHGPLLGKSPYGVPSLLVILYLFNYLFVRPCEPPSPNPKPPPRPPPVTPYCHCDSHSYSPREEQYKQLLEKEMKLCQDYEQLRKQVSMYFLNS